MTRAGRSRRTRSAASRPEFVSAVEYPAWSSTSQTNARSASSSSTTSTGPQSLWRGPTGAPFRGCTTSLSTVGRTFKGGRGRCTSLGRTPDPNQESARWEGARPSRTLPVRGGTKGGERMRRKYTRLGAGFVLALALALVAGTAAPGTAEAGTSSATFTYTGSGFQKRTLIDTGLVYIDGCVIGSDPVTCFPDDFPGTVWFRFRAGIKSTVVTAQTTNFKLDAPDTFRQDTTAALSTTNTAIDAAGKEVKVTTTPFVQFDVAYDAPFADCPKSTIQTTDDLDNANTSGCLDLVAHTGEVDIGSGFDLLAQDGTLPY